MITIQEIITRIKAHWNLKIVLALSLNVLFYPVYFALQRYPIRNVNILSPSYIDLIIPFMPGTVYIYLSLSFLMPIAPWLMTSKDKISVYCKYFIIIMILGFAVFYIWPTACPRPVQIMSGSVLYDQMVVRDNQLNAFPSLHAAFAVYSALCCAYLFRRKGLRIAEGVIWIWAGALLLSTMTTKQHLLIDVMGGSLLGAYGYLLWLRNNSVIR